MTIHFEENITDTIEIIAFYYISDDFEAFIFMCGSARNSYTIH
jgi:hypothetical protein